MKPYTFIFVGRSGAGKGTQLELLKKYITEKNGLPNYEFIMGGAFRDFMKNDGYAQKITRDIINSGNLMPDFITISLFTNGLLNNLTPEHNLFIDGIPRSVPQSEAVMANLEFFQRQNPIIIDIAISTEEATKRMMSRGRADDTEIGIKARFAFYDKYVLPAVAYIKEKSGFTYLEINGERSIEEIHADIITQLSALEK